MFSSLCAEPAVLPIATPLSIAVWAPFSLFRRELFPPGTGIARSRGMIPMTITCIPEVMVVDDDLSTGIVLGSFLSERGYSMITVDNGEEAVRRYQAGRPAAVILDVAIAGPMNGLDVLAALKKIDHSVPVIVLSGQGRTATVVQAMKLGASDYVSKPFDISDLELSLTNALGQYQRAREMEKTREELAQANPMMLFGHSERMIEVRQLIDLVADTDVTVVICGESGTGKELVARAIYSSSLRRNKPFVKVNCAALPAELLESELFGFERGAFTGAVQGKPGKFEFANHGTMFLDEIGEMSVALQAKLLQVLQDGEFSRLGGKHDVHVDVRIVAATNRDLNQAVVEGHFREDLFFRLNVVCIKVPPLRERREEVPVLCAYFLKKYSAHYNKPYGELSRSTMDSFMEYSWPGNVRELENLIKRTVVLGSEVGIANDIMRGALIAADGARLPVATVSSYPSRVVTAGSPAPGRLAELKAASVVQGGNYSLKDVSRIAARGAERELILKMLQENRWNRKQTAGKLGISYKALLYKIKDNGLDQAS
jgi:two-component system response regulator AtoC